HTRFSRDWSSDVCSSDLEGVEAGARRPGLLPGGGLFHQGGQLAVTLFQVDGGDHRVLKAQLARPREVGEQRLAVAAPGVALEVRSEERRVGRERTAGRVR